MPTTSSIVKPSLRIVATGEPDTLSAATLRGLIEAGEPHAILDTLITPELAALCLTYNESGKTNRKMSRGGVASAAAALRENRWENTGEPVIFSDAQMMNDGQHRLRAIVETGIPAVMDLRFGVVRRAFAATNSGGKRTGGDALTVLGAANTTQAASVARLVIAYESDRSNMINAAKQRRSNDAIVRAVERWPDIPEAMRYTAELQRGLKNAAVQCLAFFALRTGNDASVRDFFKIMETGEGRASDPPHRLRETMLRHRGGQDSGTRVTFLAMGVIAWNIWRRMPRKLDSLVWKPTMEFPRVDGLRL